MVSKSQHKQYSSRYCEVSHQFIFFVDVILLYGCAASLGLATYFLLSITCLLGIVEFVAMTTITAPFASGTGTSSDSTLGEAGSGKNQFFTQHAPRQAYKQAAPMLGNVTALFLLAIMLAVGYSIIPRRNVEIDLLRGPLRHGHGHATDAASNSTTTEVTGTSSWPLKYADAPQGDRNPINDSRAANQTLGPEDTKDISAV
jgi:hypothetical protein